jgi:hypothetical protein
MAIPTTKAMYEFMLQEWEWRRDPVFWRLHKMGIELFDFTGKRVFLQRPRTDDMMQMVIDLGIEPPASFSGPSYDGLTFRFERCMSL